MNENQTPFSSNLKLSPRLISFAVCSQRIIQCFGQTELLEEAFTPVKYRRAPYSMAPEVGVG